MKTSCKKIKYYPLVLFSCILLFSISSYSQNNNTVKNVYGKILYLDTPNIELYKTSFTSELPSLYDVYHIKVKNYEGDTMLLGIVYNIKNEFDSILNLYAKVLKDTPYTFLVHKLNPCKSSFPRIYECWRQSKIISKEKHIRKNNKYLLRIIQFSKVDDKLWNKLVEVNSK